MYEKMKEEGGLITSSEDLLKRRQEEVDKTLAEQKKLGDATLKDYFMAYNPSSIAIFNPETQDSLKDMFERTPIDRNGDTFKEAKKVLGDALVESIYASSNNNSQFEHRVLAMKAQQDPMKRVEADNGFENILYGLPAMLTTPGSLVTLPFAGVKASIGLVSTIGKSAVIGAGLGAVSEGLDASVEAGLGMQTDVSDRALIGAAFGGVLGAAISPWATRNARRELALKEAYDAEKNNADMFEIVDDASGIPHIKFTKETEKVKREIFFAKDSDEYKKEYNKYNSVYESNLELYTKAVDDYKAIDVKTDKTVIEIQSQLDKVKESLKAMPDNKTYLESKIKDKFSYMPPLEVRTTKEVKKTTLKDIIKKETVSYSYEERLALAKKNIPENIKEKTLGFDSYLSKSKASIDRLKKSIAEIKDVKYKGKKRYTKEDTEKLFELENTLTKTEADYGIKKAERDKIERTLLEKELKKVPTTYVKETKTGEKETIEEILNVEKTKKQLENEAKADVNRQLANFNKNINKKKEELLKEQKIKKDLLLKTQKEYKEKLEKEKKDVLTYKEEQKSVVDALKPKEKAEYFKEFKAPSRFIEEEVETGKTLIEGIRDIQKLKKIFGDNKVAGVLGEILNKFTDFFGSEVMKLLESDNYIIRNIGLTISNPVKTLKDSKGRTIINKETIEDKKNMLKRHFGELTNEVMPEYKKALQNGLVKDEEDFYTQIYYQYSEINLAQRKEAMKIANDIAIKEDIDIMKAYTKAFNDLQTTFPKNSPYLKSLEAFHRYNNNILDEAKQAGIKELEHVTNNKVYLQTQFDKKALNNMESSRLQEILFKSMREAPEYSTLTNEMLKEGAVEAAEILKNMAFNDMLLMKSFVLTKAPMSSNLLHKTLFLDPKYASEILKDNMIDLTHSYDYKMTGRIAVQSKFNTYEINDILDTVRKSIMEQHNGAVPKKYESEIQAIQLLIDEMLGYRQIAKDGDRMSWRVANSLSAFQASRLLGMTALVQTTELASTVAGIGFKKYFTMTGSRNSLRPSLEAIKTTLYEGDGTINNSFAKSLHQMGYLSNMLSPTESIKYGDFGQNVMANSVEKGISKVATNVLKYGGMLPALHVQEVVVAQGAMRLIEESLKDTISEVTTNRLARMGLSVQDARKLSLELQKATDDKLETFDLSKLSKESLEKYQVAVNRLMNEVMIKNDSVHLPAFMKDLNPLTKVMTQFFKAPLIGTNILLRRGLSEEHAAFFTSIATSVTAYMFLQWTYEESKVALGLISESERKFDIFNNPDDSLNLFMKGFGYTASLGAFTLGYDIVASLTPLQRLGATSEYRGDGLVEIAGPTAGMIDDLLKVIYKQTNGEPLDDRDYKVLANTLPGISLPYIRDVMYGLLDLD